MKYTQTSYSYFMNSSYTKLNIGEQPSNIKNQFETEDEHIINSLPNMDLLHSFEMKVQKKCQGKHTLDISTTKARLNLQHPRNHKDLANGLDKY